MACEDTRSDASDVIVAVRDAVVEAMAHGVIVVDDQGCVVDINPAAQRIVGRPGADARGQPVSKLFSGWSDLVDFLGGTGKGRAEVTVGEDAERRVLEVRFSPLRDRGGDRLGRFLLLQDVTERQTLERALAEAREAVEASEEEKAEFMSIASHEMRTPITSIKGYADLLARGKVGPLSETQANFSRAICVNADRMAALVSDLSDVAKLESGRLRLELGSVDVSEVVKDAVEGLRTSIDEKDQVLDVDVADNLPVIEADEERLVRLLTKLIDNAHKFTPSGGQISIRAEPWTDEKEGQGVVVAVQDNGIGIRPEEQEKVFEKFYRSEDRAASEVPGSGLGLTLAAGLVAMHAGQIRLESAFREGTTVTFTLPVTPSS